MKTILLTLLFLVTFAGHLSAKEESYFDLEFGVILPFLYSQNWNRESMSRNKKSLEGRERAIFLQRHVSAFYYEDEPSFEFPMYVDLFIKRWNVGIYMKKIAFHQDSGTGYSVISLNVRPYHYSLLNESYRSERQLSVYKRFSPGDFSFLDVGVGLNRLKLNTYSYSSLLIGLDRKNDLFLEPAYNYTSDRERYETTGAMLFFRYIYTFTEKFKFQWEISPVYFGDKILEDGRLEPFRLNSSRLGTSNSIAYSNLSQTRLMIYGMNSEAKLSYNLYKWINLDLRYNYSVFNYHYKNTNVYTYPYVPETQFSTMLDRKSYRKNRETIDFFSIGVSLHF